MDDLGDLPRLSCSNCPYTTSSEDALKIHLKYMHKTEEKVKIPKPSRVSIDNVKHRKSGKFMCPKCPYSCSMEQVWHFFGSVISITCRFPKVFKKHLIQMHQVKPVRDIMCQMCSFKTHEEYKLKLHMERIHAKIKKFFCHTWEG